MNDTPSLCPLLVVRGAARAIDFYQTALGARVLARYEHGAQRHISHADLALGDARFAVTEELREWNSDAPETLAGSPVVLQLSVPDAAAALDGLCAAGASVVFPLQTFAGERLARVRDPFGHLWILREVLEPLSVAEIQRHRDELFAQQTAVALSSALRVASACPASGPSAPAKEGSSLSPGAAPEQAATALTASEPRCARVHVVLGPVGAGKTTFARALARERVALAFALDDWMTTLFSPDRPAAGLVDWYRERAERSIEQIWKLTRQLTARGEDVVLEIGLLRREERERFYARVDEAGLSLTVYVLDAARDVRRARVLERNRRQGETFSMVVPPEIFELASDLWQAPEPEEQERREVRWVQTG